ncbi:hypothetical protein [Aquiflexum sp.]|uniref:hypothetical protein n=1 Tax=Aquiflexum sp. TaxID=1872584 RepID=UPI003594398E
MSERNFDLDLTLDPVLYHRIKEQTDLYIQLFQQLAGDFPQQKLSLIHPTSKGTKVTNGYRLDNCPYQVLDIARDFDPATAFNIRILNWWGNGLFVFILYGKDTLIKMEESIRRLLKFYIVSDQKSPWDYKKIINKNPSTKIIQRNTSSDFFQIYRRIDIDPDFDKTYAILKKEITFIFDNHY